MCSTVINVILFIDRAKVLSTDCFSIGSKRESELFKFTVCVLIIEKIACNCLILCRWSSFELRHPRISSPLHNRSKSRLFALYVNLNSAHDNQQLALRERERKGDRQSCRDATYRTKACCCCCFEMNEIRCEKETFSTD